MKRADIAPLLWIAAAIIHSSSAAVTCPKGWGSSESHTVPENRINDGYCDCPTTGADEPATEACSGHASWPGSLSNEEVYVLLCSCLSLFLSLGIVYSLTLSSCFVLVLSLSPCAPFPLCMSVLTHISHFSRCVSVHSISTSLCFRLLLVTNSLHILWFFVYQKY
jgi:hypothetical protein